MNPIPRPFHAFARTPQQIEETRQRVDNCCSLFYPVLCSIYNAASATMVDAMQELQRRTCFKHNVKHDTKTALEAYDRIERRLRQQLADRYQLWLDVSDEVYTELHPIILRMISSCAHYLKYKHVQDYDFKALLQTSITINDIAEATFDRLMKEFKKQTGLDLSPLFSGGTFRDVAFMWHRGVRPVIQNGVDEDVDLNRSTSFRRAVKEFITLSSDYELYNRCSERALRVNPDIWHYLSSVDRSRLENGEPLT